MGLCGFFSFGDSSPKKVEQISFEDFPVRANIWERANVSALDLELGLASDVLLSVVLVITLIDPSYHQKEYSEDKCSGALISETLVLTAASCILHTGSNWKDVDPFRTSVLVRKQGGQSILVRAKRIFIHHKFRKPEEKVLYNFAIVETDTVFDAEISLLPYELEDFKSMKETCVIGGYGLGKRVNKDSFNTIWLKNTSYEEMICREPNLLKRVCLHFRYLEPCQGDVASPMICQGRLFAIYTPRNLATMTGCYDRYGTIFTPVFALLQWIDQVKSVPEFNMDWINNPVYVVLLCAVVLFVIGSLYYLIMHFLEKRFQPMTVMDDPFGDPFDPLRNSPQPLDTPAGPKPVRKQHWGKVSC